MEEIGFNWGIVFAVIVLLVFLDKAITLVNIQSVQKNFPDKDAFAIEKNPLARFFFTKLGLWGGSIVYFFISIATFLIALFLLNSTLKFFVSNSLSISLYALMVWYMVVIGNNLFFLLKFNRMVP